MRVIKFNIIQKRFLAMSLIFACIPFIPLFPLLSESGGNSIIQGTPILEINQGTIPSHSADRNALLPGANKNFMADVSDQNIESFKIIQDLLNIQQSSNRKNKNYMTALPGSLYSYSSFLLQFFISMAARRTVFKSNRHLTVPHSIHAPPYFSLNSLKSVIY